MMEGEAQVSCYRDVPTYKDELEETRCLSSNIELKICLNWIYWKFSMVAEDG